MTIELTSAQRQQLFEAVVGAYPSKASLAQAVYYEFGTNPNVISSGDSLQAFAQDIVSWAEVNGRTEELVKAVRRANPSNEPLLKFEKTLYSDVQSKKPSRSVQPGPPTSAPSTPKLPTRLRSTLIEALLRVPGMDNFQMRSAILIGIPFPSGLAREPNDPRQDLDMLVEQLSSLSQLRSGTWPLLILVDNARSYAEGADAKTQLDKVYQQLLKVYGVEDRPRVRTEESAMVELTFQEGARLIRALRMAFPSRVALKQVIFNHLGQDLDAIADDDTYCGVLVRLVAWVEAERRTSVLIQGARRINPGNEWLRDFETEYNRSHPVAAGGVAAAAEVLTGDLRQQLVGALLRLPVTDSFPGRTAFLLGISASLNRAEGNAQLDLESVLDQLDGLGRMGSGEWPLILLIDNARSYAQGFAVENDLSNLRHTLKQAYVGH